MVEVASPQNVGRILFEPWYNSCVVIGDWPSGKAVDSGSTIGGSNPSSPATVDSNLSQIYSYASILLSRPRCSARLYLDCKRRCNKSTPVALKNIAKPA